MEFKNIYTKVVQSTSSILYILTMGFILCSLLSFGHSIAKHQDLTVLGFKPIYIISGSMEDGNKKTEIKKDSIIISKRITEENINKLKVGDVITFNLNGIKTLDGIKDIDVTHRLVEINDKTFTTKGDANDVIDNFDTDESLNGTLSVSRIKYKMVMTNNWISKVINLYRNKPVVFGLYSLAILFGLIVINIINNQIYDKKFEIKIRN